MKTVAEVLRGAVQVLNERGWTQNIEVDEVGQCCALGAVRLATAGGVNRALIDEEWRAYNESTDRLLEVLQDDFDFDAWDIDDWNDEPDRTVDEVKAALLAAAERAEATA